MERKTKGSYVQEDMRPRPNQQLPESKTVPEAVSEDLPVDSALEFARDSLNPATNLATRGKLYISVGTVNVPRLLWEWPQLLSLLLKSSRWKKEHQAHH